MSDPKHFWSSGMQREQATLYLLDLCGSDSQNYTELEAEVTCERCLAALRAGSSPPSPPADAGPSSPVPAPAEVAVVENGVLDRAVRAAVLKEREEIVEVAQAMRALDGNADYKSALRHLIDELRRRP